MKKIVVFTGAGISAESGLSTFRDSDGLWEKYSIEEVCTPEALSRNRALVVEFYNKRRRDAAAAQPNAAHRAVAALEQWYASHKGRFGRTVAGFALQTSEVILPVKSSIDVLGLQRPSS